jgi:3-deoxy-D-manno-octulosonate 8-phosphate phosphatase (KDO 8-P phosphatase)
MPELPQKERAARVAAIELLVLDVDGVLTDGSVVYAEDLWEIKAFHVRDGSAIKWWRQAGKRVALISGRSSAAVARRAAELGIDHLVQGADAKLPALRTILTATGCRPDQACAVGDDLPDLPLLRNVGLAAAVADAADEVKQAAHFVTRGAGGHGAVREVIELLLKEQGLWQRMVERYQAERL